MKSDGIKRPASGERRGHGRKFMCELLIRDRVLACVILQTNQWNVELHNSFIFRTVCKNGVIFKKNILIFLPQIMTSLCTKLCNILCPFAE